jgi:type IV fimbrial biogenesis protein FimT
VLGTAEGRRVLISLARAGGFSLIEMLIAVAVMTIMLLLALPNFSIWMQNTQIRTAGEAILNGMQLARAEAVRRNTNVELEMTSVEVPMKTDWTVRVVATNEVIQSRLAAEGSASAIATIAPGGMRKVTFNGFGSITGNNDGSATIAEIKIDSVAIAAADSRELCVLVRAGGNVRLCDPQVDATDTRTCIPPLPAAQVVPAGCL